MPLLLIERVVRGQEACTVVLVLLQLKQKQRQWWGLEGLVCVRSLPSNHLYYKKLSQRKTKAPKTWSSSHKKTHKDLVLQSELFPYFKTKWVHQLCAWQVAENNLRGKRFMLLNFHQNIYLVLTHIWEMQLTAERAPHGTHQQEINCISITNRS